MSCSNPFHSMASSRPYGDRTLWWRHQMEAFPRYWPFVRGIHWFLVNSPYKGQWRGALMFTLICSWINGWVNNREAGDLRCHHAHYDIIVRFLGISGGAGYQPSAIWLYICKIRVCKDRSRLRDVISHNFKWKIDNTLSPGAGGFDLKSIVFKCVEVITSCVFPLLLPLCEWSRTLLMRSQHWLR